MRSTAMGLSLVAAAILFGAVLGGAQVPEKISYQVMLTDDMNQPLGDQAVQLIFRIYAEESGGSPLWTETQTPVTNSIGVASVILGAVTPLDIAFAGPRWLEVQVGAEIMEPRRELVAAPYAREAHDAMRLGGEPAEDYVLSADLSDTGVINTPDNPMDWTKLKGVPGGFADSVDDGLGDGNSLDAPDGDPIDALYIDDAGNAVMGAPAPFSADARLMVRSAPGQEGAYLSSRNPGPFDVALFGHATQTSAVVGNALEDSLTITVPIEPSGVSGIGHVEANGGFFAADGAGYGADCRTSGSGAAVHGHSSGVGYSGQFEGTGGVHVRRQGGFPALDVAGENLASFSDAGWFSTPEGVIAETWAIWGNCSQGSAGYFTKYTDDDAYAVAVFAPTSTSEGLYVDGTLVVSTPPARTVATSRGTEAVFGVSAPEVEVMASGTATLAGGSARVDFDRLFAESVAGAEGLRVTATPVGAWSAIYVERIDGTGFVLRSDAGDRNVEFHWVAVGRAKDYSERPAIQVPDRAALERVAAEKMAAAEAAVPAPAKAEGMGVVTRTHAGQ